jgi:glutamate synthase (NADPH/NADH) small chain
MIYRVSSAHEENGDRVYAASTTEFVGDEDGNVKALRLTEVRFEAGRFEPVAGTEREIPAELVLLAMGFVGPEQDNGLVAQLGLELDERGNIRRDAEFRTNVGNVFAAGDAGRGQSLIVWAIAEGRSAAAAVDRYLGGNSNLAAPIEPTTRQLLV